MKNDEQLARCYKKQKRILKGIKISVKTKIQKCNNMFANKKPF